jgi:poly-gamma-glutamate capsule biosynthesis protein CapA/YwtB (metallophosphatase superfamily)
LSRKTPRWFRDADRSHRFELDRSSGRITPPDRETGDQSGEQVRLYASGDIIWERDLMRDLLPKPADFPLGEVRKTWEDGDLVFAQLETCFNPDRGEMWDPGKRISYVTDPGLLPHFLAGGFNLACQASNHTMDHGLGPIEFTRKALSEAGIAVSGSGADLAAARTPVTVEVKGYKIALLSYATDDELINAGPERPGNAPFRKGLVLEDILRARQKHDFIIVSVHRGREFVYFPSPQHQADCRAMVDAGADVILGHHPHVMQGIEWRRQPGGRQAVIFYSLGSLLVDYEPPLSKYELGLFRRSQQNNYVACIDFDRQGVAALQLTPVRQTDDWRVRLETDEEAQHTWDLVEWSGHPVNHVAPCRKFWVTSWPYLAIQYPSIWMHLCNRPSYFRSALRWFFREETLRLQWGAIFAREIPEWIPNLRGQLHYFLRLPIRLARHLRAKRGDR